MPPVWTAFSSNFQDPSRLIRETTLMEQSSDSTSMERFLKPKAVSSRKLARDLQGRLLMAEESALDIDRIRDAGITVTDLGRRVRVYTSDMTKQLASYIVPVEVCRL